MDHGSRIGGAQTRRVVEAVHEIETLKDMRDLGALLVPALRTPFRSRSRSRRSPSGGSL